MGVTPLMEFSSCRRVEGCHELLHFASKNIVGESAKHLRFTVPSSRDQQIPIRNVGDQKVEDGIIDQVPFREEKLLAVMPSRNEKKTAEPIFPTESFPIQPTLL
jgi:hypothetical protein